MRGFGRGLRLRGFGRALRLLGFGRGLLNPLIILITLCANVLNFLKVLNLLKVRASQLS